jgi:class 3 adenylate cyclase
MSADLRASVRTLLERKQSELDLMIALDQIRDSSAEPSSMLASIVNTLADRFRADLCLLAVMDRDTGELELKAVSDRGDRFREVSPESIRRLAECATAADSITVWNAGDAPCDDRSLLSADLRLAAVPIIMGPKTRLGGVLLGRIGEPFTQSDLDLLKIAETQLDSAVIQGYAYYELQQRNKELEVIFRIDRVRDRHLPFDEMLNTVLYQLRDVLEAEMGFIMLYNRAGQRLEMRAFTHDDLFKASPYAEVVDRLAQETLDVAHLTVHNDLEGELSAVMCVPLILDEEILGVFGCANRIGMRSFTEEDRRLLNAIASQMDTAIFENLEQRRLRQVLGRSVDRRVMERLLSTGEVGFLRGERIVASVLYCDIRGSTSLAERTEPELLVGFINDYLGAMVDVILRNEGTVDKFVGDEVMALFGAPFPQPDHALRAVRAALEMQAAYQGVMDRWGARGVDRSPIGIGVATGELIAGEMGSEQRTNYTVIGRAANLGARICAVAEGGQVLVSQATYDLVRDQVEAAPIPGLEMKGLAGPVTVYDVTRVMG